MRVSAKAEYACIAMLELAANYAERQPVRVKAIADAHGIPQRFLVQILLQLKAAGLVMSLRGAAGGYQLARAPHKIALAEVINAIERSPQPRPAPVASPHSPTVQAIRAVWHDVHAEEQRMLEAINLAELVRRAQESNSLSYQI
jgi:Rrf2 family transcriptional regulator, cysteine metabolism repressor